MESHDEAAKKEGRSAILIIRSLSNMDLQESTVQRVLSIILDAKEKYGEETAEQKATELMGLVEMSETEEDLLKRLYRIEKEILEDEIQRLKEESDKLTDWLPM